MAVERLTGKSRTPRGAVPAAFSIDFIFRMEDDEVAGFFETMNRLADYEDTGYSPEDFDKLCREMSDLRTALGLGTYDELREAIQDNRVVILPAPDLNDRILVLPCPIGTPVYTHDTICSGRRSLSINCKYGQDCARNQGIKCPIRVVKRPFTLTMYKNLRKTFWLTKEEAEAAIPASRRA